MEFFDLLAKTTKYIAHNMGLIKDFLLQGSSSKAHLWSELILNSV